MWPCTARAGRWSSRSDWASGAASARSPQPSRRSCSTSATGHMRAATPSAVELARPASFGLTASYFQYAKVFRRPGMIHATMGEWKGAVACLEESVTLAERIPYPEAVRSSREILAEQELL